jgi:hypothetical protein
MPQIFTISTRCALVLVSSSYFSRTINLLDVFWFHFQDIYKVLSKHSNEVPKFDDVKDEIFDMVKPKDPLKITIKDLVDR